MNGSNRLYRSTSQAILGGVAAGIGNYFNVDPTLVRIIFAVLTFFSGGTFFLAYLALWLVMPTAGSTASQPGDIVRENLNDIGSRVRGYTGGPGYSQKYGGPAGAPNSTAAPANGEGVQNAAAPQSAPMPPALASTQARPGATPQILIAIGVFFLLANLGLFHAIHLSIMWPLILVGLGFFMMTRRNA